MAPQARDRDFEKVGGLKDHIRVLKEMIIYPLLYRELFDAFGVEAPRGVLFHGPPGTGKTLVAGAVAAECSKSSHRRVSFYMRKGADCLNKYVGESEKHLQNLFSQAHNTRPSIIFFDEIDGLVPTRSESREQVHASVVSTLLALMDGLDSKSEVFVIGATNRIDMIDPALRRPGRFDRELYFPLPPLESRIQIFDIHTRTWNHKPSSGLIHKLASDCAGYCGADIQSLCAQAVMNSFRRHFPQVSDTSKKYPVNFRNLKFKVEEEDFREAKETMIPASQRTYILPSRPLSPELEPLLRRSVDHCISHIRKTCPFKFLFHNREEFSKNKTFTCPRFLLLGNEGQGHVTYVAPAILHSFDHLPVTVIDMTAMSDDSNWNTDAVSLMHKIKEARQSMPAIIYLRDISSWWHLLDDSSKQVLVTSVESLDTNDISQVFLLGTISGERFEDVPSEIKKMFPKSKSLHLPGLTKEERKRFFGQLLVDRATVPPKIKEEKPQLEEDEFGSSPEVTSSTPRRRSRRKRRGTYVVSLIPPRRSLPAIDKEWLSVAGSKPKLGSYYRKFMHHVDRRQSSKRKPYGRKRRLQDEHAVAVKRTKTEGDAASCSKGAGEGSAEPEVVESSVVIDSDKLESLVEKAVDATEASSEIRSVIGLYEELEIVILRYASQRDRSSLPEELEREISVFAPT